MRRRMVFGWCGLCIACLLAGCGIVFSGTVQTAPAGQIAFSAPDGDGARLLVVDPASPDDVLSLAECAVACEGIAWSADRTQIGLLDGNFLRVVDLSGDEVYRVEIERGTYAYNVQPSWTGDLRRVTFHARYDARHRLVVVDLATGEAEIVGYGERPVWLPDERRIGYTSGGRIRTYDLGRSESVILTPEGDYHDLPAWSPDGRMIAFRVRIGGADYALAVMDADGSNGRVLLTGIVERPAWSPDGRSLATVQWNNLQGTRATLYIADVQSGDYRALSPSVDVVGVSPVWSGDGAAVAFWARPTPSALTIDLYAQPIREGAARVLLAEDAAGERHPPQVIAWR